MQKKWWSLVGVAAAAVAVLLLVRVPEPREVDEQDEAVYGPLACALSISSDSPGSFLLSGPVRVVGSLCSVGDIGSATGIADDCSISLDRAWMYLDILRRGRDHLGESTRRRILLDLFTFLPGLGPNEPPADAPQHLTLAASALAQTGGLLARDEMPLLALLCLTIAERWMRWLPVGLSLAVIPDIAFGYRSLGNEERYESLVQEGIAQWRQGKEQGQYVGELTTPAYAAVHAGFPDEAYRFLEAEEAQAREKGEEVDGYGAALWVNVFLETNAVPKALEMARRIERPAPMLEKLCEVALAMLDGGDQDSARLLLPEIERTLKDVKSPLSRAEAAGGVVVLLARLGEQRKARKLLADALSWLEESDQPPKRKVEHLAELATAAWHAGDRVEAFDLLAQVNSPENIVRSLTNIFEAAWKANHRFSRDELDAMYKLCPDLAAELD
jgi:hypothetical protein